MSEPKDGCTCEKCVGACKNQPGWFAPGEAEKAAELLGMPWDEFRDEYLVREYWVEGAIVHAPRRTNQPRGCVIAEFGAAFMEGPPCIFLDENERCKIHAAKPFECRESMSCRDGNKPLGSSINDMWIEAGMPLGHESSRHDLRAW